MTAHSTLIGGSTASRLLNCPGSHELLQKIPDAVETPSPFAEMGTALHEATADCIINQRDPLTLLGATYNGLVIDEAGVAALRAVMAVVDPLLADGSEFVVEIKAQFPKVPAAFGTCDFAVRKGNRIMLYDWKFGQGVEVAIRYEDGQINPQPVFYAAALRHSQPDFCEGVDEWELGILQPALSESVQTVAVDNEYLDWFVLDVVDAVAEALSNNPNRSRGPWCRFAACKTICPLWTGPLLDLSAFAAPERQAPDYGASLAAGLALADLVEPIISDIRKQAFALLTAGGVVPGHKLVPKRAVRSFSDEDAAIAALIKAGFDPAKIMALRSPAQVEKVAKAIGKPMPKSIQIASISSGSTLAKVDDPRPEVPGTGAAIEQFRQALREQIGGFAT